MLTRILRTLGVNPKHTGLLYRHPERRNILLAPYNTVYFFIPKIASSSIKVICLELLNVSETVEPHEYDYPSVPRSLLGPGDPYFKFALVRNPYDRLVSCYKNKVVHGKAFAKKQEWANLSFGEFVDKISTIPHDLMDPHFRPQYCFLTTKKGLLLPDYIGRFESLTHDFAYIKERAGFPDHIDLPVKNTTTPSIYSEYFNKQILDKTKKIYAKDLDLFGYEF